MIRGVLIPKLPRNIIKVMTHTWLPERAEELSWSNLKKKKIKFIKTKAEAYETVLNDKESP